MDGISCDRCGDALLVDADVRYLYTIEMVAAYDPLELTHEDMERDFDAEYRKLLRSIEKKQSKDLESQVYVKKKFDLCPDCQRAVLRDPLAKRGGDPLESPEG